MSNILRGVRASQFQRSVVSPRGELSRPVLPLDNPVYLSTVYLCVYSVRYTRATYLWRMSRRILRAVAEIFIAGIEELTLSHVHAVARIQPSIWQKLFEHGRRLLSIYHAYVLCETFCNFVGIRRTDYRDYIRPITEHVGLTSAADRTLKKQGITFVYLLSFMRYSEFCKWNKNY